MPSLQEPRLHLQQQETKCMTRVREERAAGIRETGGDTEKKQKEEERERYEVCQDFHLRPPFYFERNTGSELSSPLL